MFSLPLQSLFFQDSDTVKYEKHPVTPFQVETPLHCCYDELTRKEIGAGTAEQLQRTLLHTVSFPGALWLPGGRCELCQRADDAHLIAQWTKCCSRGRKSHQTT